MNFPDSHLTALSAETTYYSTADGMIPVQVLIPIITSTHTIVKDWRQSEFSLLGKNSSSEPSTRHKMYESERRGFTFSAFVASKSVPWWCFMLHFYLGEIQVDLL